MNENNNDSHQQNTTCTLYIYKDQKNRETFIYREKARHFAKSETICDTFLLTKSRTLYITRFFINFLK